MSGLTGRWGLAARLLIGIGVVLATAAVSAWLVASAVGPSLFHEHMVRAGLDDTDAAVMHAEAAFQDAGTVALALALAAAAAASAVVSLVLTRRIGRSLATVSRAAVRVGAGRYEIRVPTSGLGAEFEELARSFNAMAGRLREAEGLRARLLADVAHEVRTPVATLVAYLEAIEEDVQPLDAATIAVLRDQAARLARLAEDLADVTHAEAGDVALEEEDVDARALLAGAARAGEERAAPAGIELRVDDGAEAVTVRVDRARMAQVLDNIVVNAVRHTPAGGSIVLDATGTDAGWVELTVTDTGEGITAEHLPHVFERFYRVDTARDRTHGGSGIGLAISKALVEAHGGLISAASDGPGRGTTFTIALPLADSRHR